MKRDFKPPSKVTKHKRQPDESVRHDQKRGYLTKLEHEVAEAAFEVIIPSDTEPGAKEAGSADFLNNLLSKPTMYSEILDWRMKWRWGIKKLEDVSLLTHNSSFRLLSLSDRTDLISMLSQGRLPTWDSTKNFNLDQKDFFKMMWLHAIQGFLSDPIYGGNKNKVGWKFIGFDG
jgi:hypothetical protein